MVERLFSFFSNWRSRQGRDAFRAPEGQRIYAVGDIHGRADLLKSLQEMIRQDAQANTPCDTAVVYLGDYLDRGPFIQDTVNLVINGLPEDFQITWLRGNHEQMFADFLQDPSVLPDWIDLGGLWTLTSYGLHLGPDALSPQRAAQVRDDLVAGMPEEHLDFLRQLPLQHQLGDYLFVHAGVRPGIPMEEQAANDLLWIRDEFLSERHDLDCMVVHGHTVERQPEPRRHRLGIDTGAYATGVLTCAVLEEDSIRFLATSGCR